MKRNKVSLVLFRESCLACKFEGSLISFRARVADEGSTGILHSPGFDRLLYEEFGEGAGPEVVVEIGCVNEGFGL